VEYPLLKYNDGVSFSAGIGADIRIRILNDLRSEATSSAEPLITLTTRITTNRIGAEFPLWTRFYSNGISFAFLPQFHNNFSERVGIFLRYELTYLTVYGGVTSEWRQDSFLGVKYVFGK
jgi:hypothetical protein